MSPRCLERKRKQKGYRSQKHDQQKLKICRVALLVCVVLSDRQS